MKVQDIRSFFGKPGTSKGTSNGDDDDADRIVDVPSRLKKGGSKKSKKEELMNVNDDDSDAEDPLPRKLRKQEEDKKQNGKSRKKVKPIVEDEDSDIEEPLPKSLRAKDKGETSRDKKRKARVLSESDEDDDFKSKTNSSKEKKPALKVPKVDTIEPKKKVEERKAVNPADFFSSAPVKRETREKKVEPEKRNPTPEKKDKSPKKEVSSSPKKVDKSPKKNDKSQKITEPESKKGKQSPSKSGAPTPPKSKPHNGSEESSPHRPPTSLIAPKKLKMETPTPEKRSKEDGASSKPKSKKSPEKAQTTFKVPTPVAAEKSKPRTSASSSKRSAPPTDEDDEDDFDPTQKASKAATTPSGKKVKGKKKEKTPSKGSSSETDDEKSKAAKANYMKFLAKQDMKPRNLGSKMIPIGAPGCLQGITFVITGVLESLEREDCKDIIVKYGGRVTTSLSKKTGYLMVGDDPGESKTRKATELNIPIISEDAFLEMIRKSNPNGQESQDSGFPHSDELMDSEQIKSESDYDADKSLFSSPGTEKKGKASPKKPESSKLAKEESPRKRLKVEDDVKPSTSSVVSKPFIAGETEPMWVDKYRPKTLKTVVGQGGDKSNAKKLISWLENWFKYHGSADDKAKAAWKGLRDPEGKTFKAALLSGPPGIGKTTTAHLAVKEVGYDFYELNASDTRNKRGLHENVADALSNKTLVFGKSGEMTRKHVLIMDEVDGMSGNEDRGGVQELINLIKNSRIPIICICNDRNHQKIRSLSNYCYDLRFYKPSFEQLRGFVSRIAFMEKIKIPQEKVHQLICSTDFDVRQILHQLELFKEGKTDQAFNPKKDLRFGPWDVIRRVFLKSDREKMSIHDKTALFFQDYSIGPLFVQENYPKWTPAKAGNNSQKRLTLLAKTAASIADAELAEAQIRRTQNWSTLPVQAVFATYIPGEYMESDFTGGVDFPQWLGKNSNQGKRRRLLQSLHTHLQLHVSGSLEALNMDYMPYLQRKITKPLSQGDVDGAADVMEAYTLLRDDVDSITDLGVWPGMKNLMESVESRTKAAFTRKVNKEVMLPYSNAKPVKKGRGGGGGDAEADLLEAYLEEGEGGVVEEEEEDESVEKDAMVKMKTKKATASSSKAKASSSSSSSRGGKKGKKADDFYDSDEEDYGKSSKGSKSKPTCKPRKK